MRATERFGLIEPSQTEAVEARLSVDGQVHNTRVPGTKLEAQFELPAELDARYLLLTSYNSPFEETIHVILLGEKLQLLETKNLGAPHTPGILERPSVVSGDTLRFEFQGVVTVTVHEPRGLLRRRLSLTQ